MKGSALSKKEIKGISIYSRPTVCVNHGSFFVYITDDHKVCSFESDTLQNTLFPPPDKNIKSHASYLAISPSHQAVSVGYEDGSIQLFDTATNKANKVISKPRKSAISSMIFIDDNNLLFVEKDGSLYCSKVSGKFFGFGTNETLLNRFDNIILLSNPNIFAYQPGSKASHCLAPLFTGVFGVSTESCFYLCRFTEKFEIFYEVSMKMPYFCFRMQSTEEIAVSVSTPNSLVFLRIDPSLNAKHLIERSTNNESESICFLSQSVLCRINGNICTLFSLIDQSQSDMSYPGEGLFINSHDVIFCITETSLFSIKLESFASIIEFLTDKGDIEDIISFCKKALLGDPSSTVGLPLNNEYRALLIEKSLSNSFRLVYSEYEFSSDIASKICRTILSTWISLGFKSCIGEDFLNFFLEKDVLLTYFNEIIIADPTASLFFYSRAFVESLIMNSKGLDIECFLMNISPKLVDPSVILKYAVQTRNDSLISNILINRIHDTINQLNFMLFKKEYGGVFKLVAECESSLKSKEACISWLFHRKDINSLSCFPNIEVLLECEENDVEGVLLMSINHVKASNSPFSLEEIINAIVISVSAISYTRFFRIFQVIDALLFENNFCICDQALKFFFRRIFGNDEHTIDYKQRLLDSLMISIRNVKIKEALITLCSSKNMTSSKIKLLLSIQKYEQALYEMILQDNDDCFLFLNNESEKYSDLIQSAILENSAMLISKDVSKFISILIKKYKELILKVIDSINDENTQNIFMRFYYNSKPNDYPSLPHSRSIQFCRFLCMHYPNEVLGFIQSDESLSLDEILIICQKQHVYDACSYIGLKTRQISVLQYGIQKYLEFQSITFCKSNNASCINSFQNVYSFVKYINENVGSLKTKDIDPSLIILSMIKSFTIPIRIIDTTPLCFMKEEKQNLIKDCLTDLIQSSFKIVPFNKTVDTITKYYSSVKTLFVRDAIIQLLNEYSYNTDTLVSLAGIYKNDQQRGFDCAVEKLGKGRYFSSDSCQVCHSKLINSGCPISVLECGHVFHCNKYCYDGGNCEICNGENTLNESKQAISSINENQKYDFSLFEKVFEPIEIGNIIIPQKGTVTLPSVTSI